jgi:hypothetical protein
LCRHFASCVAFVAVKGTASQIHFATVAFVSVAIAEVFIAPDGTDPRCTFCSGVVACGALNVAAAAIAKIIQWIDTGIFAFASNLHTTTFCRALSGGAERPCRIGTGITALPAVQP